MGSSDLTCPEVDIVVQDSLGGRDEVQSLVGHPLEQPGRIEELAYPGLGVVTHSPTPDVASAF